MASCAVGRQRSAHDTTCTACTRSSKTVWRPLIASRVATTGRRIALSQPRDHHFVPVFYLKQWTNQDGKLIEYSKPYGNKIVAKPVGPRATGFQTDLYAFQHLPPELAQYLEGAFLKRVDTESSAAL